MPRLAKTPQQIFDSALQELSSALRWMSEEELQKNHRSLRLLKAQLDQTLREIRPQGRVLEHFGGIVVRFGTKYLGGNKSNNSYRLTTLGKAIVFRDRKFAQFLASTVDFEGLPKK